MRGSLVELPEDTQTAFATCPVALPLRSAIPPAVGGSSAAKFVRTAEFLPRPSRWQLVPVCANPKLRSLIRDPTRLAISR